jgi:hypothetical protein
MHPYMVCRQRECMGPCMLTRIRSAGTCVCLGGGGRTGEGQPGAGAVRREYMTVSLGREGGGVGEGARRGGGVWVYTQGETVTVCVCGRTSIASMCLLQGSWTVVMMTQTVT